MAQHDPTSTHGTRHAIVQEDLETIRQAPLPWEAFRGKTVLVTGCNGIIPAYFVETLLSLNEVDSTQQTRVVGLARNRERAEGRFAFYRGRSDLEFLIQDASAPLPETLHADFVIHAASQASPKYYGSDPVGTLLPNVLGTYRLLEFARARKVESFLFVSSGAVYGNIAPTAATIRETDYGPLDPMDVGSCYGESKRMGENMCACWWHQHQVPTKVVRVSHTYGPGMRLDDGRVFADFVADVVQNRPIVMRSAGTAVRPFTYLTDTVTGAFAVLLKGVNSQAYNICNSAESRSVRELAEMLVGLFPERGLSVIRDYQERETGYIESKQTTASVPDISKARELGWNPSVSIEAGFRRTVLSFL